MHLIYRYRLSFFRFLSLVALIVLSGCSSWDMHDYELVSSDDLIEMFEVVQDHVARPEKSVTATASEQSAPLQETQAGSPPAIAMPQPEAAEAAHIEETLRDGTLNELAQLRPQAEVVLREIRVYEWLQPWADWLLARLDYLDIAHEALLRARAEEPTQPGQPLPPPAAASGESIQRKAQIIISDRGAWMRRLAGRPAPVRAKNYLDDAKAIFTDEGVPPQWVWLAEVESSWNPEAISPVGARGLFQLMPATAGHLGLSLDPVDERVEPDKNARAAARYLRRLYHRFDSWPLTLAAYNAGEGRVSRLLAKQGEQEERTFAAIANALPAETQMYVPRVLATVELREGIDPLTLPAPARF